MMTPQNAGSPPWSVVDLVFLFTQRTLDSEEQFSADLDKVHPIPFIFVTLSLELPP